MVKNILKVFRSELLSGGSTPESEDIAEILADRKKQEVWIAIAGITNAGKSSLFNVLFNPKPKLKEGNGKPGTLKPVTRSLKLGKDKGVVKYTDLPGIGDLEENEKYIYDLNLQVLKRCDLIVWLFKCDHTSKAIEQKFYKSLPKKIKKKMVYGLSKIDQASGNWYNREKRPSNKQVEFILNRVQDISETFGIKEDEIIDFSVKKNYRVNVLLNRMLLKIKSKGDVLRNKIEFKVNPED